MMKLISNSLYYLFIVWFIYGFYDIYKDNTLSSSFKMFAYFIEGASLLFVLLSLVVSPKSLGFFYFLLGFALLVWYMYYTPKDMVDPGYSNTRRFLYLTVDYTMIICILCGSMFFTYLEKIAMDVGSSNLGNSFYLVYNCVYNK